MKEELSEYLHYLNIERGLSANTRKSYERDLEQYLHFMEEKKITSWQMVDRYLVIQYLEKLHEEQKATATITRMISSLRRFHQFLRQERYTDHDPMQHIDTPKKAQKLPSTLTLKEVETLIETPDTSKTLGIRDRAILEVMYATGMRVSELISLKLGDLHLSLGLLQTIGKGDKERIIPLGDYAIQWLERYLDEARPLLVKDTSE
ncbi:MAG: site-specific integrase, partial [Enterococcus thailandicus]|nr:site-specific integrase [Enterococcus thailandicus]